MREPRHISSRAHALVKTLHRLATEPAASRRLGQVWLEGDHLARAFLARGGRAALAVVGASAWLQPGPRELALQAAEIVVIDDALLHLLEYRSKTGCQICPSFETAAKKVHRFL